jgi:hypothetical protein
MIDVSCIHLDFIRDRRRAGTGLRPLPSNRGTRVDNRMGFLHGRVFVGRRFTLHPVLHRVRRCGLVASKLHRIFGLLDHLRCLYRKAAQRFKEHQADAERGPYWRRFWFLLRCSVALLGQLNGTYQKTSGATARTNDA